MNIERHIVFFLTYLRHLFLRQGFRKRIISSNTTVILTSNIYLKAHFKREDNNKIAWKSSMTFSRKSLTTFWDSLWDLTCSLLFIFCGNPSLSKPVLCSVLHCPGITVYLWKAIRHCHIPLTKFIRILLLPSLPPVFPSLQQQC